MEKLSQEYWGSFFCDHKVLIRAEIQAHEGRMKFDFSR